MDPEDWPEGWDDVPPDIRAWVTASRAAQGLPPTVQNPAVIERIAAVFASVVTPVESQEPPHPPV